MSRIIAIGNKLFANASGVGKILFKQFLTSSGDTFITSDGKPFKVN